jgi:hypothetical protein
MLKFEIVVEEDIALKDRYLRSWSRFVCHVDFCLLIPRYFVQNSTVIFSLLNESDYTLCIVGEEEFVALPEVECIPIPICSLIYS